MAEPKPKMFDGRISAGSLITIALVISGFAVQWGVMRAEIAAMRESYGQRIEELEASDKSLFKERMREARDVADMRADMRWIRSTLERLERDWKSRE